MEMKNTRRGEARERSTLRKIIKKRRDGNRRDQRR